MPKRKAAGRPPTTANPPNCETQQPVELNDMRQSRQEILSLEEAQRMAEFFGLLGDANHL